MDIDIDYEKVETNTDFGNHYSYFQEDIYYRFPEPMFEKLDTTIIVDSDHRHYKVTGSSITEVFSVVRPTQTN